MDAYSESPPPYREHEQKQSNTNPSQFRIARKPISTSIPHPSPSIDRYECSEPSSRALRSKETAGELEVVPPALPPRPELSLDTTVLANLTDSELYLSPLQTRTGTAISSVSTPGSSVTTNSSITATPSSANSSQSSTSLYFQNAYKEVRHFAGGLISHPYEHTKHYSILRHSHGLVFYQGSGTTLAVSIFADAPLPADRTIWLQSKGWTGTTGMRAKAFFGRNGNWLNVTPSAEVKPEQLKPDDERAWQRDIAKFLKKADRRVRDHILRETVIARIPAEAGDGYFQLVLCIGDKKKVLCPSPVFRVFSMSASAHSIKGASLATLPLELGAMALGIYARTTIGNVVSPVTSVAQSQAQKCMPSLTARETASLTYMVSGASKKVKSTFSGAEGRYEQVRDGSFALVVEGQEVSLDQGPGAPYPIRFVGRCDFQSSENMDFTIPKISISKVPDDICHRLHGYYFGWARLVSNGEKTGGEGTWHQAVISSLTLDATQLARASIEEASRRFIAVGLICQYENTPDEEASIEVLLMGFLRPDELSQRTVLYKGLQAGDEVAVEAATLSDANDIYMTLSILGHPSWTVEAIRERSEQQRPDGLESIKFGYANTRMAAQRHIDRVPLHKIGVRMPVDQMRDKAILTTGFYVVR